MTQKPISQAVERHQPRETLSYDDFTTWRYKQPRTATWGLYRDTTALDAWLREKFPDAICFQILGDEVRVFYKQFYNHAIDGLPPTYPMDKRLQILWENVMEAYRKDDIRFFSFTSNESDTEREYCMTWKQLAKFHNVTVRAYHHWRRIEAEEIFLYGEER